MSTPNSGDRKRLEAADALPPPPPPNVTPSAPGQVTQPVAQTRQLMMQAASAVPPTPPDDPASPETDPNRKYGYITTPGTGRTQRYSYISEGERQRKSEFLRANPEFDFPPGDPINAPQGAKFAVVVIGGPEATRATYWYTNDADRETARRLIAGE